MPTMNWTVPAYSKKKVNTAGDILSHTDLAVSTDYDAEALEVINNWRSSHAYPLNVMQNTLRRRASRIVPKNATVAQRLKRLPSIKSKLVRFNTMNLTQMQDIGGCRVVLPSLRQAQKLFDEYKEMSIKHKLHRDNDYVANPQDSGYRGYHLIYKYHSDKTETYNGLLIELQIRSRYQHMWATAVETVGTFSRQPLKSSIGNENWLRFFTLMGSYFAMREGDVPENPSILIEEIKDYVNQLDVIKSLRTFNRTARIIIEDNQMAKSDGYALLQLDFRQEIVVRVDRFNKAALDEAASAYYDAEKRFYDSTDGEVVLVSVKSVRSLRQTYPNYFLDMSSFLGML